MDTVKFTLATLGALVVIQTALSFVRSRAWWVRVFDFPRPQIALCSLLLLALFGVTTGGVAAAAAWERVALALLALAVLAQLWQIVPYTRCWRVQVRTARGAVPEERRLRFVISNVCMTNPDTRRWLDLVRAEKPDVVVAVEADTHWCEALRELDAAYPHRILQPQDNTYGVAVCSRLPLGRTRVKHLVESDVPSIFTSVRLPSGESVRAVVLHPRPPRPDIRQDSSLRDAELVRAGLIVREFRGPVVVAGDLNDVAWSHTTHLFQRVARLLDPRIGRGLFATFPVAHRVLRFPLDHVFHSNHFDLVEIRRLPDIGSDHFPMLIELALRPADSGDRPEPPQSDADDEEQAIDAIEDAREMRAEETPEERRRRKSSDT